MPTPGIEVFTEGWAPSYRGCCRPPTVGTARNCDAATAASVRRPYSGRNLLLHYAVVFFVIALIAALFGFGGIAAGAVGIAKILFFVFLAVSAITFLAALLRRT
jgi:uncharacterized membrane protein YtjA (UPF0391 family)